MQNQFFSCVFPSFGNPTTFCELQMQQNSRKNGFRNKRKPQSVFYSSAKLLIYEFSVYLGHPEPSRQKKKTFLVMQFDAFKNDRLSTQYNSVAKNLKDKSSAFSSYFSSNIILIRTTPLATILHEIE